MAGGAKERSSVASEGHMQAHTKRRPVIVGAVALRVVECRCDRRTAAANKTCRDKRGRKGDLDVPFRILSVTTLLSSVISALNTSPDA